jgi:O-methyltransferase
VLRTLGLEKMTQKTGILRSLLANFESIFGIKVVRMAADDHARVADLPSSMQAIIGRARCFSMTSVERLAALCTATQYIANSRIPGAFVECGVWRGGSSMAAAWTLLEMGRNDVDLHLFDTFEGMSEPTGADVELNSGKSASELLAAKGRSSEVWAYAPMEDVRQNLSSTLYPSERLHFVRGRVEDTIPKNAPGAISILRLDTDWYESTRHELVHLFPRLSPGGILIVDDYGAWAGARQAVDEYFSTWNPRPYFHRIDNTGRMLVKQ